MYNLMKNPPQVECDGFTFKIENSEPSEYAREVARRELRETPENVEHGLRELRRLLKEEKKLVCPSENDNWLMSFLRPAHFYPESALKMIRNHYKFFQDYPEVFKNLTLESTRKSFLSFSGSAQPQRDQDGRRIYIALLGKYWDTENIDKYALLQQFVLECLHLRTEPDTQICGIVIMLDVDDMKLMQSLHFTPNFGKCLLTFLQEAMCLRLKQYHVINDSKIFRIALNMGKIFMTTKFKSRLHFHSKNLQTLHRYISPSCLPQLYGGKLNAKLSYGPQMYELLQHYKEEYEKSIKYGYKV